MATTTRSVKGGPIDVRFGALAGGILAVGLAALLALAFLGGARAGSAQDPAADQALIEVQAGERPLLEPAWKANGAGNPFIESSAGDQPMLEPAWKSNGGWGGSERGAADPAAQLHEAIDH